MSKRILLCDDSAFIRMMMKDILNRNGYEVCGEAADGLQAAQRYEELKPDLVLLDAVMPEADGAGALAKIKAFDPDAAVIILFAEGERKAACECVKAGARGTIAKPFKTEQVLEEIKRVIG